MQTKDSTLINGVLDNTLLTGDNANYYKTARPAYYIEIYEGSIYEWQADPTSAVWNRIDCSTLNLNFQQGQSKTISAQLPIEMFRTAGALNYNYDTGVYISTDGTDKLSKGYLIRAYSGYCDFTAPYAEHVKLRFTGIIESILPNDDGIIEVNGVDFSVIFMNALNYNYPDINSYRDLPWTDSTATITAPINATDQFIYVSDTTKFNVGAKIKIDSEVMMVLNITPFEAKLTVQRLSGVAAHNTVPTKVYSGDEYLVMPDDVYNDNLLNKYVPAYDNWRLDYAIRDLCIKAKFPLALHSIAYNDSDTIRLGRADKYPYMQSKSIFERLLQANSGVAPKMDRDSYTADGTTGYAPVIEKKVYAGIDEDMLNDAKFKLEFGQSLWDAILTLTEGFGFKVFFNEQGVLTIKAVRQYTWLAPENHEDNDSEIIENHVWSWTAWDIKSQTDKRYTFDLNVAAIPTAASIRNLRVRFIANTSNTDSATIQLVKSDSDTWTPIGTAITIPALKKYQYYEAEIYRAVNADTAFVPDVYGVVMTNTPTTAPYFNGLLYLDNNDEVISFTCDNTLNAIVSSAVNSSAEVRNQMTIIGLPDSPQPIISRAVDTTSIYNGKNAIKGGSDGTITFSTGHVFMDGRYDKYALLKTSTPAIIELLTSNLNLMFVYVKPQTTPLGAIVSLKDATSHAEIVSHTITANDLTSGGFMFKLPTLYTKSTIELYCATDLYISEIECYEYDPAYNFVGHKKETIVVKKNISDKATSDWISLTQLEMHRRNIKQFSISSLSNPYIEIGDCGVVAAPEVGAFNDTRLWVTGISTEISRIGSADTLTVVALPPMQSYIKPPNPASQFLANKAYGFSITRKQVSSNTEIAETAYIERTPIKLLTAIDSTQTTFTIYCDETFTIANGALIQIDSEYMLITSCTVALDVPSGKYRGSVVCTRAKNYTVGAAHLINAVVIANEVCSGFQPPDEYLTFNFALTRQQKVQIVVGALYRKHTLAYVMEEKILDAGVYKRENGIRWDGGINFAKVWPESVNKIYLMPNDSFNYMYNRMFHIGATTGWEDAKYNFYWWQFDQDIKAGYPDARNVANATSAGWIKTPTQYDASLIVKPVLNGFSGSTSIIPTERRTIAVKTNCHVYKLKWKAPIPTTSYLSSYQPVSIPIQIKTDSGAYQDINDAVYFDAYVTKADGGNVNLINTTTTNTETARRWVVPIGLNQIIQWDFTDSQGKTITAGAAPGSGYKMTILNVFDIYGEGVEVIVEGGATNLIDGSMKPIQIEYGNFFADNPMWTINKWSIVGQGKGEPNVSTVVANTRMPDGPWNATMNSGGILQNNITRVNYIEQPTGGQTGTDGFVEFAFWKSNKVTSWSKADKKTAPALIKHALEQTVKISTEVDDYYFRMFTKPRTTNVAPILPGLGVTLNNVWNPWLFIEYRDTSENRECKIKYFQLTISETRDVWTSCSLVLNRVTDLSDVDIVQAVGVELRCLDNTTPSALLLYTAVPQGTNPIIKEYLGIDSVEFGTGSTIPATYTDPAGSPRTSSIFYLTD